MSRLPLTVDTVIIGAGAAGLACGLKLLCSRQNFLVLEQSDTSGGMIQTVKWNGFILERGPFNVLVRSPEFAWLLQVLGSKASFISANSAVGKKRYVLYPGAGTGKNGTPVRVLKAVPHSVWSFAWTSALTRWEKTRAALGLVASKRGQADDTVDAVVRRRLGNGIAEKIASAGSVGIWGAESHELEAAACLPRLTIFDRKIHSPLWTAFTYRSSSRAQRAGAWVHKGLVSFSGGLGELAKELANELGDRLAYSQEVQNIERVPGAWRLTTQSSEVSCKNIVLACGAGQAATLMASFAPESSERIRRIPHSSLATVNFGFRRQDIDHPLDGYGFLVPKKWQTPPLLGVLFSSVVFPHYAPDDHILIRAFLGGTRHPDVMSLDDHSLSKAALRAMDQVLGLRSEPCLTDIARWNQAIPRYTPGHTERIRLIRQEISKKPGLWLAGNFMSGISVNDCISRGVQVANAISENAGERNG